MAEVFIKTLKKNYKYMTLVSKIMDIDKLDDIANKYSNTYHSSIKMKPVNAKQQEHILTLVNEILINTLH